MEALSVTTILIILGTSFAIARRFGGKTIDQDPYEIAKLGDFHLPAGVPLSVGSGVGGTSPAPDAIPISDVFPVHGAPITPEGR